MNRTQLTPYFLAILLLTSTSSWAGDWPMWKADAQRSGKSKDELPDALHLQWVRQLPALKVAWPDHEPLWFDQTYRPVVAGRMLLVGSSQTDSLAAFDTRTGEPRWTFQADGPIRLAPVIWQDKAYVTSDDGYLYCLNMADGKLKWKFRGGPGDRKILGNNRLISTWPARGGPVVLDGKVYFTASVWPFMGVFIHSLDAESGDVLWTNNGEGSVYQLQPHSAPSFAGIAPQGALAAVGPWLLVPGGRSVPAGFQREDGKMVHFQINANNKRGGGADVAIAGDDVYFNGGYAFDMATGQRFDEFVGLPVIDGQNWYFNIHGKISAYEAAQPAVQVTEKRDSRGKLTRTAKLNVKPTWNLSTGAGYDFIQAGSRLYAAGGRKIVAVDLPAADHPAQIAWETVIDQTAAELVAADDRLFVISREGSIYCFAGDEPADVVHHKLSTKKVDVSDNVKRQVAELLKASGVKSGYAVVWGAGDGEWLAGLLEQSDLKLIVVESDAVKAATLRQKMTEAGLYGERLAVHVGRPGSLELPPYLASLMICLDPTAAGIGADAASLSLMFHSLRPYGGAAWVKFKQQQHEVLAEKAKEIPLERSAVKQLGEWSVLSREGALPDAADWTHEHADASNTRSSQDARVKLPLGVLWFGGPSNEHVLPRHGHGPQPQVVEGRLFIEGPDMLRGVDVYTGLLLWEREFPGLGVIFDNTSHQAGANATGSNYVSHPDGIYLIHGPKCLQLDLATGRTLSEFTLPVAEGQTEPPDWTYINIYQNYLIAGSDVTEFDDKGKPIVHPYAGRIASKKIWVLDRKSGEVRWSKEAQFEYRNNSVCLGGDKLFVVDLLSDEELDRIRRRGEKPLGKSRLTAFELQDGKQAWTTDENVFGTWLGYSHKHGLLVESGRPGRDVLRDEKQGMRAYRVSNGEVVWNAKHKGPPMLQEDRILLQDGACDLLTGEMWKRVDPITGLMVDWTWTRNYGCNTPQAAPNMLVFRSGAAGFYDLAGDGGTGNFGGFKSSCTNNLIVANGVLSAPDYTRTCTCAYQVQTSLALVPMPDVELWTLFPTKAESPIKQLGLNLGAPGHRRAADGTLWVHEFKTANVVHSPEFGFYRGHSSAVAGEVPRWISAFGCRGIESVTLDPGLKEAARYTVRLYFCDPDNGDAGKRLFDVELNGRMLLKSFDTTQTAGGQNRGVMKEFTGVALKAGEVLEFKFRRLGEEPATSENVPMLNGLEIRQEVEKSE